MRVLHLAAGNLYGGVEVILATLAVSQRAGMQSEFGLCFDGKLANELRAADAAVHLLGPARIGLPTTVLRARRELRRLLRERDFDAVVCHSAWPHVIFGTVIKTAELPLVFGLHDAVTGRHWLERLARTIVPDLVICNSRFTMTTASNIHPGVTAEVVYYPVRSPGRISQTDRLSTREDLSAPSGSVVILQVSRLETWKGHMLHLAALRRIADLPNWVCWIAGGPQRPFESRFFEQLKSLAKQYSLEDRVRFLGFRADIPRLTGSADVFCQPNTGPEPFGIAFVEALYAGLPVVTTAMGGAKEIVDDSCGILVHPGDIAALASALRKLIVDKELRYRLAGGAPGRAGSLCDADRQLGRLEQTLSRVLSARPRSCAPVHRRLFSRLLRGPEP